MSDFDVHGYVERAQNIHGTLADAIGNPNKVYCRHCGRSQGVNAAQCLRQGWPKCCGYTMTIDEPEPTDDR